MKYLLRSIYITIALLLCINIYSQDNEYPKEEMRAAWLATVVNLDWPAVADRGDVEAQKSSLTALFDSLQSINLNTVFFQVRTECDALYNSAYEPWSRYLTSIQGLYPGYDPLEFALTEAHNRGMELHAWMNPYRVNVSTSDGPGYYGEGHVYLEHPEWILDYGLVDSNGKKILNPGLPDVQQYLKSIIGDLISKYDVDGIHFDDYFYAYGGTNLILDSETQEEYGLEDESIGDFRRRSINQMVAAVWDTIQATRPYIRFGISPFGIYGNGLNPPGIVGLDAYNVIYCDPLAWLDEGTVDYINPQLYWPTGGSQDFATLLPWWAERVQERQRHVFAGHGIYRLSNNPGIQGKNPLDGTDAIIDPLNLSIFESEMYHRRVDQWNLQQVVTQVDITRENKEKGATGSVFFRSADFNRVIGLKDKLKERVYSYPSIYPPMPWKPQIAPQAPSNIDWVKDDLTGSYKIKWNHPRDSIRYVLYASDSQEPDLTPENMLAISYHKAFSPLPVPESTPNYLAITSLDRYGNESESPAIIEIETPEAPELIFPPHDYDLLASDATFSWTSAAFSASYRIEFCQNTLFESNNTLSYLVGDTTFRADLLDLTSQTSYYWRVFGMNISGRGEASDLRYFEAALPTQPMVIYPINNEIDVVLNPEFSFDYSQKSDSIHLQLSKGGSAFAEYRIVLDTILNVYDLPFRVSGALPPFTTHYCRIRAINAFGTSSWSEIVKFKTLMPVPGITNIYSPLDNEIFPNISSEIEIGWGKLDNSSSYILQVADDQGFNNILFEKEIFNAEAYTFQSPTQNNWHFIRVAGKNIGGIGEWSSIVRFGLGDPSGISAYDLIKYGIKLYPNPFNNDQIKVLFSGSPSGKYKIEVHKINGKLLAEKNLILPGNSEHTELISLGFVPCDPCILSITNFKFGFYASGMIYSIN